MTWKDVFVRFKECDTPGQQVWLVELLYHLSMTARATYEPGGDGVEDGPRLRRFNELMHRTATQLRAHWNGRERMPDDVFADALRDEVERLGVPCPLGVISD